MEKWSLTALADGLLSQALSASTGRDVYTVDGGRPHLLNQHWPVARGWTSMTTLVSRPCRCCAVGCGPLARQPNFLAPIGTTQTATLKRPGSA